MSTATLSPTAPAKAPSASPYRVTFGHLLRAEWIKLWTVRSTIWTLAMTVVVMVGLVAAVAGVMSTQIDDAPTGAEAVDLGLTPFLPAVQMASIAVVVLGVLAISGEYTTGMIRSSVAAAPRRTPVLWSKLAVLTATILVVAAVAVALGYAVAYLFLSGIDLAPELSDPQVLRVLGGCALYLATIAAFAFAIGALLRHSAAALATILALLLVVENVVAAIPWEPLQYVSPFLPATAGSKITQTDVTVDMVNSMSEHGANLTAWQGYGVLVAWVVVLLGVAAVLMKRRDV
ncbi:ABC transporter permease subunit [Cellulomonas sp. H30R-01]|uniref:ABC transporter permease subunit n=1 Tax=Cellulomonas sp. H30R-01 TaxID=2704467 RepID=UPI00138C77C8|nr:ABC transporter permease subunit [Cellulomonas sp. H30R-01]QHT54812.1 ABC transporter permease subunit [Cellulomonas sp. H30R-01]